MDGPKRKTVTLITGGTRGIGKAIARRFAEQGATLALTYRHNQAAADVTAEELRTLGTEFILFRSDVSDPREAAALPGEVVNRLGRLGVLVNNAGGTYDGVFLTMAEEEYAWVIDTNLLGALRLSLAAAPHLRASQAEGDTGAIVIVSSMAGVTGKEGQVPYASAKGGLIGLTRLLARRLGADGVRVNAIAPGFIHTEMVENVLPKMYRHILDSTALGRMGEADEVAGAVAFLAGRDAGYLSGAVLRVDGGLLR